MSFSRWKMMAGVLSVSLGGLATVAGQCPKKDDTKGKNPLEIPISADMPAIPPAPQSGPLPKTATTGPAIPPPSTDVLIPPPAPISPPTGVPVPPPVPMIPAPSSIQPVPNVAVIAVPSSPTVLPLPGVAPPAIGTITWQNLPEHPPQPIASPSPQTTVPAKPHGMHEHGPAIVPASAPTAPQIGPPAFPGESIQTSALPPTGNPDSNVTPPPAPQPFGPSSPPPGTTLPPTPIVPPGTGATLPPSRATQNNPPIEPTPYAPPSPTYTPPSPSTTTAPVPAVSTTATKFRIVLRVGEGEPTFEVRSGDDLILKVACEKVDVKSPEKGSGPSTVKASGKVHFAGFGAEGTCEELTFLAGTGEVALTGGVKIQVKDKLGRVESELSSDTVKYKLDSSSISGSLKP
jgi:hypothetical protein